MPPTAKMLSHRPRNSMRSAELSGVVITKLDGTAKGGIAITIADEFDMPIKYIGVGEGIDDIEAFDAAEFAGGIFNE
jgi:fused signal recognition particle receptor